MRFYKHPEEITIAQSLPGFWGMEMNLGFQKQWHWIDFRFKLDRKTDHAGFHFELELFGYYFYLNIQDSRHWNYKEDRWYYSGEESNE